jgi:hypothetical protein
LKAATTGSPTQRLERVRDGSAAPVQPQQAGVGRSMRSQQASHSP